MASGARLRSAFRRTSIARSRDLEAAGFARAQVARMAAAGELVRVGRGLYTLPDNEPHELESLVYVARRSPRVVFCLLTALRFHDLTTQAPHEVWIAVGNKDRAPRIEYPQLRVVRAAYIPGHLVVRSVKGVELRITSIARTIVDCFKFRNKVGTDVAVEALRDALSRRRATPAEIATMANACRAGNVIRPYLEAMVT